MTNPVDTKGVGNSTLPVDHRPDVDGDASAPPSESTLAAGPPVSDPADLFTGEALPHSPDAGVTAALPPVARPSVGSSASPDPKISRVLSLLLSPKGFEQLDPTDPGIFFIRYQEGGLKKFVFLEADDPSGLIILTLDRNGQPALGFIPPKDTSIIEKIRATQQPGHTRLLSHTLRSPFETTARGEMMALDLEESAEKGTFVYGPVLSLLTPKGFDVGDGKFLRFEVDGYRLRSWLDKEGETSTERPSLYLPARLNDHLPQPVTGEIQGRLHQNAFSLCRSITVLCFMQWTAGAG